MLKNIKLKKAPGIDEIPPEIWKQIYSTHIYLYSANKYIIKALLIYGENVVNLCSQQKGDLSKVYNYRGIILTSMQLKYTTQCYETEYKLKSTQYCAQIKMYSVRVDLPWDKS